MTNNPHVGGKYINKYLNIDRPTPTEETKTSCSIASWGCPAGVALGGGGGYPYPPREMESGVTFDEVEAAADSTNQLEPPPAATITQTQGEQGIPLTPAVPALGLPLPPAAPVVGGGDEPTPTPTSTCGGRRPWGGPTAPQAGMRHTPVLTPSFKNWGTQCTARLPLRPTCSSWEPLVTWQVGWRSTILLSMFSNLSVLGHAQGSNTYLHDSHPRSVLLHRIRH